MTTEVKAHIRTLIVDDEFLARKRLEKLLKPHDDILVIGEARGVDEAIELIKERDPDLVFLDIQMPDGTGFNVLSGLSSAKGAEAMPIVVFATAFDEYAIPAFDAHAIDYLLKPFDDQRLGASLDRVREMISLRQKAEMSQKLKGLLDELEGNNEPEETGGAFTFKEDGFEKEIPYAGIAMIEAAGNYVTLHTEKGRFTHRMTMTNVENELKGLHFLRVHRSVMINEHYVREWRYCGNNEYEFALKTGQTITSSRTFKPQIVEFLKGF